MQTGLSELREICKPLALATAFEPVKVHDRLACIWLLALELDKAILLPKESMLRLIRLQWWYDAIETGNTQNVPLMQDICLLLEMKLLDKDRLFQLIEQWQAVSDAPEQLSHCWEALLVDITQDDQQSIRDIGYNLFCVLQRRPDKLRQIESILATDNTEHQALLKACRYLSKRGETVDIQEDGTLGFRLFLQFLFSRRSI